MPRTIGAFVILLMVGGAANGICGSPAVRTASAGMLTISPMKLTFGRESRSAAVTVRNTGEENIAGRVTLFEWTQDATGRDDFQETEDIAYFPKVMTLLEGEERIIRLGFRGDLPVREKAYRLVIGMPSADGRRAYRPDERPALADLAVFVRPLDPQAGGLLEQVALARSALTLGVRNTGNVHLLVTAIMVRGIAADGHEAFSREIGGWYVLGGFVRTFRAQIPQEDCRTLSRLDIRVITDSDPLTGTLNIRKDMCTP